MLTLTKLTEQLTDILKMSVNATAKQEWSLIAYIFHASSLFQNLLQTKLVLS